MTRDLLDLTPAQLRERFVAWGLPAFRARQVLAWVYQRFATSYEQMTDLPAALRARLMEDVPFRVPEVAARQVSADGSTTKVLLRLADGNTVEAVLMRYEASARGRARNTVCISTQVGCAMGCVFCATGQQGFLRNLSAGEIVAQVLHFARALRDEGEHITNIVFMGMGEPLANYAHTLAAVRALQDPEQFGLGARHMTISTVGLVPAMRRLAGEHLQVGLALSLHAENDELRRRLVPTTRFTIDEMLDAAQEWARATGRRFSVEYALVDRVNDSEEQARVLAGKLKSRFCHVNLIPVNPTANPSTRRSRRARVLAFERELRAAGVNTTVRVEKGVDIAAGCGQLRGQTEGRRPRAVSELSLLPAEAPFIPPGEALPEADMDSGVAEERAVPLT
jgi:23S rRNA (adenine2503-C2)-methyltransferase